VGYYLLGKKGGPHFRTGQGQGEFHDFGKLTSRKNQRVTLGKEVGVDPSDFLLAREKGLGEKVERRAWGKGDFAGDVKILY